jgi:hypothetical protein
MRRRTSEAQARTPNESASSGEQHCPVPPNPLGLGGTVLASTARGDYADQTRIPAL